MKSKWAGPGPAPGQGAHSPKTFLTKLQSKAMLRTSPSGRHFLCGGENAASLSSCIWDKKGLSYLQSKIRSLIKISWWKGIFFSLSVQQCLL